MMKNSLKIIRQGLVSLALATLLAVAPAIAQDSGQNEFDILLGNGDSLASGGSSYDASEAQASLLGSRGVLPRSTNSSAIIQQGNNNSASQFSLGSTGTTTLQRQYGNNNESNVLVAGSENSGVFVDQFGNNHQSNISLYNAQGTNVINLQTGNGKRSDVFVIGNAGVIVGNKLYLNDTGRPIRDVIVIGR